MRVRRLNRRRTGGSQPTASKPRFFYFTPGQVTGAFVDFPIWWAPENPPPGATFRATHPEQLASGSDLWPTRAPFAGLSTESGLTVINITFRTQTGFPPFELYAQLTFSEAPSPGDDVLVGANLACLRGPNGEWLAPGRYTFTV